MQELPATRAAFGRGELTFTKVRALTRVATASSEEGLLELAGALTASQLERALRAFRRVAAEDAREAHELEYVDYYLDDDGTLFLRARLAAEDGTLLIKALEAARERVLERRREERAAAANDPQAEAEAEADGASVDPPRPARVEALLDLAEASMVAANEPRARAGARRRPRRRRRALRRRPRPLRAGGWPADLARDGPPARAATPRSWRRSSATAFR